MNSRNVIYTGLVLLITACGGGGGGTISNPIAGITGTGISGGGTLTPIKTVGTITGFGSIFVNGIEFETDTASVTLDDNPGVQGDLKLGMVVKITGQIDDSGLAGQASVVSFDDEVQGPVSAIVVLGDPNKKQITILNKTIIVDQVSTVFDGTTFANLVIGDLLEISGYHDASNNLIATRVERKELFVSNSSEIEIKGVVSNLTASTFSLDAFTINFGSANLSDVPGGLLTAGMAVEVKGTLSGNTINASEVDQEDDFFGEDESKISMEGLITDFTGIDSFYINGQQVNASSATLFPATLTLANSISIEAEGPIVNGILMATKVEARSGDIELAGNISSLNPTLGSITLQFATGTLDLVTNTSTRMKDDTGSVEILTFSGLNAGDYLEAKLFDDGNDLVALEIKRDDDDKDIVQGPVESLSEQLLSVTLFGLTFSVDGAVYQNQNDQLISASQFFSAVSPGTIIKLTDENSDGTAEEVELE